MGYLDWTITTPFLLLSLCILLAGTDNFNWQTFVIIVGLNYLMLGFGFLAEKETPMLKYLFWLISSAALVGVFLLIYTTFRKGNFDWFFWFFVILWGAYGLVFFLKDNYKIFVIIF